jgi:hypothetical protein
MTAQEILAAARECQARHEAGRRKINYARMQRMGPKQKAALTRAINSGDPDKVVLACRAAVLEWDEIGAWPDNWSRWQRALDDALGYGRSVELGDLR